MTTEAEPTDDRMPLPEKLYKELEAETQTDAEKQAALLAVHQEQRNELGKKMRLDVGLPNEKAILADGQLAEVRDYIGLVLDPMRYSKRDCPDCYGRGTLVVIRHLSPEAVKHAIADDPRNELFIVEKEPGKFQQRLMRSCSCTVRRYRKAHALFADALVKAGLAKWRGVHVGADGHRQDRVELL